MFEIEVGQARVLLRVVWYLYGRLFKHKRKEILKKLRDYLHLGIITYII
jgi:hypothetical protein